MLHGIELAKPDEWYVANLDDLGHVAEHMRKDAESVQLASYPELDCFHFVTNYPHLMTHIRTQETLPLRKHCIGFGPAGSVLGHGDTREAAIANAVEYLDGHYDEWVMRITGWLETHPLSPRYRYTGGG